MNPALKRSTYRALWLILLVGLLWWALHKAPLQEIGAVLQQLHLWQVAVILAVNASLYVLITLRWWIIVRADAHQIPFLPLLGARVSAFGISYFTLGPQVGGEPLQVLSLQRKYGISYTRATASVLLDKLLEFLVNFWLLALGLAAVFQAGLLAESQVQFSASIVLLAVLILAVPLYLILLSHRRHPLTGLLGVVPFIPKKTRMVRFLRAAEWLAGRFCQRHPRLLLAALGISMLAGAGMLVDYALMLSFLGIHLPFWSSVAGWTAGWLAFLMPLPGGLGALESSQVAALGFFGIPAALALAVVLLMRARDLLVGGLGLLLASQSLALDEQNHNLYPSTPPERRAERPL